MAVPGEERPKMRIIYLPGYKKNITGIHLKLFYEERINVMV